MPACGAMDRRDLLCADAICPCEVAGTGPDGDLTRDAAAKRATQGTVHAGPAAYTCIRRVEMAGYGVAVPAHPTPVVAGYGSGTGDCGGGAHGVP
jgi:hypothetical protein